MQTHRTPARRRWPMPPPVTDVIPPLERPAPDLLDVLGRRRSPRAAGQVTGVAPGNKGRKYPPQHYSPEIIVALLRSARAPDPVMMRRRAIMYLFWRSALRVSEACDLEPRDLGVPRLDRPDGTDRRDRPPAKRRTPEGSSAPAPSGAGALLEPDHNP